MTAVRRSAAAVAVAVGAMAAISRSWNGSVTSGGFSVTVRRVSSSAAVPRNGSTTFGFLGNWNGSNTSPASLACSSP